MTRSEPEGESGRPAWWRRLRSPAILLSAAAAGILGVLALLYLSTWHTVWIEINGRSLAHRTREATARGVLNELALDLAPEDLLETPESDAFLAGEPIRIAIARTVALVHDGSISQTRTQARRVVEALVDLGVVALPEDRYFWLEQPYDLYGDLPEVHPSGRLTPHRLIGELRRPIVLRVERAVPVTVDDGSVTFSFNTAARTVGAALFAQGLTVYEGDRVSPGLDAAITPGLRVRLERALPVYLDDGGEARQLRTHSHTVAELLAEEQVVMDEDDYVRPEVASVLKAGMTVGVVRVSDEYFIEEVPVPFQTVTVADPNMEIDRREIMHWGREGASRTKYRVHYENGVEMYRTVEDQWLHRDPIHRATHYGTNLVYRDVSTPWGTFTYWRILRMLATSYNAPTAGTPLDSPHYGITRIGWPARKGLVAVDPRVVPLRQNVYVPGYGPAVAADTGSAIQWRRIDLCYDLDNLVLWYKWVDVYLLTPAPSRDQIMWQVPNTPVEKD